MPFKITCDFISVDNLNRTRHLVGEIWRQRLFHSWDEDGIAWGEDVIELKMSLYYAHMSLSRHYKTITTTQPTHPASTPIPVPQDQSPMSINTESRMTHFHHQSSICHRIQPQYLSSRTSHLHSSLSYRCEILSQINPAYAKSFLLHLWLNMFQFALNVHDKVH